MEIQNLGKVVHRATEWAHPFGQNEQNKNNNENKTSLSNLCWLSAEYVMLLPVVSLGEQCPSMLFLNPGPELVLSLPITCHHLN